MTTVINYNFFGIDTDAVFGDFGIKNRSSDKKQNHSPKQQRTIDITAQSRILDENDNRFQPGSGKQPIAAGLANLLSLNITYDRQGKPVQLIDSTGVYINCKV